MSQQVYEKKTKKSPSLTWLLISSTLAGWYIFIYICIYWLFNVYRCHFMCDTELDYFVCIDVCSTAINWWTTAPIKRPECSSVSTTRLNPFFLPLLWTSVLNKLLLFINMLLQQGAGRAQYKYLCSKYQGVESRKYLKSTGLWCNCKTFFFFFTSDRGTCSLLDFLVNPHGSSFFLTLKFSSCSPSFVTQSWWFQYLLSHFLK